MMKECCDVCCKEIKTVDDYNGYKIKVKRKWFSFHENGWEKLLLCNDCKEKFFGFGKMKSSYAKGYQQGREDAIEPLNAIIDESEKMMWHSNKTLEKIKEQLKDQINN